MPGFHIIARITGIARITEKLVQRSRRSQRSAGFLMIAVIAGGKKANILDFFQHLLDSYRTYLLRFSSNSSWYTCSCIHAFFIRTNNFRLRLDCSRFFGNFSLKLFLNCSYFQLIFLNSELVARNNTIM